MHLRVYKHLIKDRIYQDFKDETQTFLRKQVERTLHATNSAIVMEAAKELMRELLLGPQGALTKTCNFEELVPSC
jgi:hypothetical protein